MAIFHFKARDMNQRVVHGRIRALTRENVEEKLMTRQLTLISVSEEGEKKRGIIEMSFGGVNSKKLVVATRQLSFLINASVPIVQALDTVSNNTDDTVLKKTFKQLSLYVESGQSFSVALRKFPHIFNDLYISMVKSGEEGGSLDRVLKQLSTYIEKIENIKSKVKSAMMYPSFVTVAALVIIIGIILFLVPRFEEIFAQANADLPLMTQMLVSMSQFMKSHYLMLITGIACFVIGFIMIIKTQSGAKNWEQFLLNLPGFGTLLSKNYVASYSRTLSSLLSSGVMVVDAIKISGRASGSILIKEASDRICRIVESGHSFGKALTNERIFPGLVKNMVSVGEETGTVDDVLSKIADFYEEQVEVAVDGLIKLIEPALIIFIAVGVGFILIALYLPIFNIGGVVGG